MSSWPSHYFIISQIWNIVDVNVAYYQVSMLQFNNSLVQVPLYDTMAHFVPTWILSSRTYSSSQNRSMNLDFLSSHRIFVACILTKHIVSLSLLHRVNFLDAQHMSSKHSKTLINATKHEFKEHESI